MKSFKLVLLALLAIFIILVVYQNIGVFTHRESMRLNLWVWKYETGPILLSMYFVAFFLMGLLLSYFHGLSGRYRTKGEIKSHLERMSKLEEEIKVLKSPSPQQGTPPSRETENV
jgi:hypothetical protein